MFHCNILVFFFLIRGGSSVSSHMFKIVGLIIIRSNCTLALSNTAYVWLCWRHLTHGIVGKIRHSPGTYAIFNKWWCLLSFFSYSFPCQENTYPKTCLVKDNSPHLLEDAWLTTRSHQSAFLLIKLVRGSTAVSLCVYGSWSCGHLGDPITQASLRLGAQYPGQIWHRGILGSFNTFPL